jgi:hypothetical protein
MWQRPRDSTWAWRAVREGIADSLVSTELRSLEDAGGDVLPIVAIPEGGADSGRARELRVAFDTGSQLNGPPSDLLEQADVVHVILPSHPYHRASADVLAILNERLSFQSDDDEELAVEPPNVHILIHAATDQRGGSWMPSVLERAQGNGATIDRDDGALQYGALRLDDKTFVVRYNVDPLATRPGMGVLWAEYRASTLSEHVWAREYQ